MNKNKSHLKQIAFPREHGSWGFVIEPLALTLLIAYSFEGLLIATSAFFIFLSHQAIKIIFDGKKQNHKKKSALIIVAVYLAIALAAVVYVLIADSIIVLIPYILAIFLMSIYLLLELKGFKRNLITELIAPIAISILVLSISWAASWNLMSIFALWVLLLSRTVPTTFYVHERLNIVKRKRSNQLLPNISHLLFLLVIAYLVLKNLLPILSLVAIFLLLLRSILGLRKNSKKLTVKQLGMLEFLYGFLFVIISACGFILNF